MSRALARSFALCFALLFPAVLAAPAHAETTGTITGTVWMDLDRDGVVDAGEPPFAGHQLYLFRAVEYAGTILTDSGGRYSFTGLVPGEYRVEYDPTTWFALRDAWVPSTTGSIYPRQSKVVADASEVADFGWRPLVRSTLLGSPLSSTTTPSGIRVESYNDAVSAQEIGVAVETALQGPEAAHTTLRFAYGATSVTATSVSQVAGRYADYVASVYVTYVSWLDGGDRVLTHEYGHAWTLYNAFIVQQDPALHAYLRARGLDGDPRIDTTYLWSATELIAEDYRQLFGSVNALAAPLANRDLTPAADVPGLREFFTDVFTQPPAPAPIPAPPAIAGLAISPLPVRKSATVVFQLSEPSTVLVWISDPSGRTVRTLWTGLLPAGSKSLAWDRKDAKGRRVVSGTYGLHVSAVDSDGLAIAQAVSFAVV